LKNEKKNISINSCIYLGSGKQLQCLLSMQKSVTPQCGKILKTRQELWNSVSLISSNLFATVYDQLIIYLKT